MSEDPTVETLRLLMARIVGPDQARRGEVFTPEETKQLFIAHSSGGPCTEKQEKEFFAWCREARIRAVLLEGLLQGHLVARVTPDGRVEVKQPGAEGREWIRVAARVLDTST